MIHPVDYRYLVKELIPYLSEEAFLSYKLKVEAAHARAMARMGVCSDVIAMEITRKSDARHVKLKEVKEMEAILKHDVKAMVEVLDKKLSDKAKPYRHLGLTSNDVVNTAQALMIRDATFRVIIPDMVNLEQQLIDLARREKSTIQIGRTHGQHAEPTTFGKEIAVYVDRWGKRIEAIKDAALQLRGKASGSVGTHAPFSLLCDNPEKLESLIMEELGLEKASISTQIVQPEPLVNYFCQMEIALATLADFANNLRHLQRSEIAEVFEGVEELQISSSTMPQKRSPINLENIISQFRAVMPHIITALMNIESEHQRDLRDSAATRYLIAEVLNAFDHSVRRISLVIANIVIDAGAMRKNLILNNGFWMAEPAYLILALAGHSDAYNYIRALTIQAKNEKKNFSDVLMKDSVFRKSFNKLPSKKRELVLSPEKYVGASEHMVDAVTSYWENKLEHGTQHDA